MRLARKVSLNLTSHQMNHLGGLAFAASVALSLVNQRTTTTTRTFSSNNSNTEVTGDSKRKKSMVYTRSGDKGTSSLYNGERRSKTDGVFQALGEQDELNACVGIAREHCHRSKNGLEDQLIEIQSRLFDLGAAVATPTTDRTSKDKLQYTALDPAFTDQLEQWIDELDAQLPPLTTFILPSGGFSSSHLHLARVVCRRAERAVLPLVQAGTVDEEVGKYLNRLSDFLFVAARTAAYRENREEVEWRKANSK